MLDRANRPVLRLDRDLHYSRMCVTAGRHGASPRSRRRSRATTRRHRPDRAGSATPTCAGRNAAAMCRALRGVADENSARRRRRECCAGRVCVHARAVSESRRRPDPHNARADRRMKHQVDVNPSSRARGSADVALESRRSVLQAELKEARPPRNERTTTRRRRSPSRRRHAVRRRVDLDASRAPPGQSPPLRPGILLSLGWSAVSQRSPYRPSDLIPSHVPTTTPLQAPGGPSTTL